MMTEPLNEFAFFLWCLSCPEDFHGHGKYMLDLAAKCHWELSGAPFITDAIFSETWLRRLRSYIGRRDCCTAYVQLAGRCLPSVRR